MATRAKRFLSENLKRLRFAADQGPSTLPVVDLVVGQTQSPDTNSEESLPEPDRRRAATCAVCGSMITKACEEIATSGKVAKPYVAGSCELRDLVRGASAGCHDCVFMVKTVASYTSVDVTMIAMRIYPVRDRKGCWKLRLEIRMRMRKDHGDSQSTSISTSHSVEESTELDSSFPSALPLSAVSDLEDQFLEIFRTGGTISNSRGYPLADTTRV
jgi:hypothetical protein